MRLHRFFARNLSVSKSTGPLGHSGTNHNREIVEGSIITYAHDMHQWQRVFRYGQGDHVIIFDGTGKDYVCEIMSFQGEITGMAAGAVLRVLEICENKVRPNRQVILAVSLVKKDIFEWIAEKATELGVVEIIPLLSDRSEKKSLNSERLEKIIIEASEQSGRGDVPILRETEGLSTLLENKKDIASMIVLDPAGDKFSQDTFSKDLTDDEKVIICIGPEGGWSPTELESFKSADIPTVSLGPQILRVETAVIAALARIVF